MSKSKEKKKKFTITEISKLISDRKDDVEKSWSFLLNFSFFVDCSEYNSYCIKFSFSKMIENSFEFFSFVNQKSIWLNSSTSMIIVFFLFNVRWLISFCMILSYNFVRFDFLTITCWRWRSVLFLKSIISRSMKSRFLRLIFFLYFISNFLIEFEKIKIFRFLHSFWLFIDFETQSLISFFV